jgi:hypothetical protein
MHAHIYVYVRVIACVCDTHAHIFPQDDGRTQHVYVNAIVREHIYIGHNTYIYRRNRFVAVRHVYAHR